MVAFEQAVLALVDQANALWVEAVPSDVQSCDEAVSKNVVALQLLNRALELIGRKLKDIRQRKFAKTHIAWNTLLMYSMSWELIPGVHNTQHSFTPFEADKSIHALEVALRCKTRVLFTGGKGQGKTLLARYTSRKVFATTVYVDCRTTFDCNELLNLLTQLTKAVVVLDEPKVETVEFVKNVMTRSHASTSVCVISCIGNPCLTLLPSDVAEVRLENPSEFEIWRLRQRFATSFYGSYLDLPHSQLKTRAATVRNIQNYIIKSMALLGKLQPANRQVPQNTLDSTPRYSKPVLKVQKKTDRHEKKRSVKFARISTDKRSGPKSI